MTVFSADWFLSRRREFLRSMVEFSSLCSNWARLKNGEKERENVSFVALHYMTGGIYLSKCIIAILIAKVSLITVLLAGK